MADRISAIDLALHRRALLLAAPVLSAALGLNPLFAAGEPPARPPIFETARSQFTIVRPRRKLPPLRLQALSSRDVVLVPQPGHIALVNLWATWCAACRTDLPMLASLDKLAIPGLEIWTICTDTHDLKKISTYVRDIGVPSRICLADPFGSVTNPRNPSESVLEIVGMPITYLVGNSGHIEGYITGAADWLSAAGSALLEFYRGQSDE